MGVIRVALPDTGPNDNIKIPSLRKQLDDAGAFVPVHNLAKPLTVVMAVKGDGTIGKITQNMNEQRNALRE